VILLCSAGLSFFVGLLIGEVIEDLRRPPRD